MSQETKLVARPGDTVQDIILKVFATFVNRDPVNHNNLDSSIGHLCYAGARVPRTEKLDRFLSMERLVFFYYDPPVLSGARMCNERMWTEKPTPTETPKWTENQEYGFKYHVATLSLDGPQLPWRSGAKPYRRRLDRLMSLQ